MNDIQFIYFDIGYTLVDESKVWEVRCQEQAQTAEAEKLHLSAGDIYNKIVLASMNYQPQYRTVMKKYDIKQVIPYRHEYEVLYDDCKRVLNVLSQKYKLGIIANQTEGLLNRLDMFEIRHCFTEIISSWDYKIMKPDLQLFKIGIEKAKCRPSEIVMVGDRLDNDIYPANAVGMRTIWVKQGFGKVQKPVSELYYPTEEINSLKELLKIL